MKKLLFSQKSHERHWVGDGFPVRTIFTYNDLAKDVSPFLLMDYAGPATFPPSDHIRGVDEHPHRGFETVTIVYAGEVEHKDSAGGGGLIKAGDVQWMTAASGLVHEEKHGQNFSRQGGEFEMVQLWVNLPKENKMSPPRYQGLRSDKIPRVDLDDGAGFVRVVAGEFQGSKGPAKTFTTINLWDIRMNSGKHCEFHVPRNHTASLFVLSGELLLANGETLGEAEFGILDPEGETFSVTANADSKFLFLGGEPIREPIVGYGPFVMNTVEEVREAFRDFQQGRMGQLPSNEGS